MQSKRLNFQFKSSSTTPDHVVASPVVVAEGVVVVLVDQEGVGLRATSQGEEVALRGSMLYRTSTTSSISQVSLNETSRQIVE